MLNAISVDVEEFFHAANLEPFVPRERWDSMPSRVRPSTEKVLEIFDQTQTKSTFFVLGWVAARAPDLVRLIASSGHEIASHGFDHRLAYDQTAEEFRNDVRRTKRSLEDITGKAVLGYRAPNFSIQKRNDWAYDILLEEGYRYDSSIYPVWHPRYSNRQKARTVEKLSRSGGELTLIPLACWGESVRLPVAGGAYWRHFPPFLIRWAISNINSAEQMPCTCYLHPWELDDEQPVISDLPPLARLRHYGGIRHFPDRLRSMLSTFRFAPIETVYRSWL